jgi:hypothetical protein
MEGALFGQLATQTKMNMKVWCGRYASGIVAAAFVEVGMELEFVSEELARDVELFAADYDNVLAIENLLGDNGGESTCGCQYNI